MYNYCFLTSCKNLYVFKFVNILRILRKLKKLETIVDSYFLSTSYSDNTECFLCSRIFKTNKDWLLYLYTCRKKTTVRLELI